MAVAAGTPGLGYLPERRMLPWR